MRKATCTYCNRPVHIDLHNGKVYDSVEVLLPIPGAFQRAQRFKKRIGYWVHECPMPPSAVAKKVAAQLRRYANELENK